MNVIVSGLKLQRYLYDVSFLYVSFVLCVLEFWWLGPF